MSNLSKIMFNRFWEITTLGRFRLVVQNDVLNKTAKRRHFLNGEWEFGNLRIWECEDVRIGDEGMKEECNQFGIMYNRVCLKTEYNWNKSEHNSYDL